MRLRLLYFSMSWFCLGELGIRAQVTLSPLPSRELGHPPATFNPTSPFLLSNINPNLTEGRELYIPSGVALDTGVSPPILYIADTGNNRVLGWQYTATLGIPAPDPNYRFPPADIVIGQNDRFTTNAQSAVVNANGLAGPTGLAVDGSGNLYVADSRNNRVLRFPRGSTFPDMVIGQTSLNSNAVNQGQGTTSPSANTIFLGGAPVALVFDKAGNLYLNDVGNNRVLRYAASDLAAGLNGPSANLVIGQTDFNSSAAPQSPFDASQNSVLNRLRSPAGMAIDGQNRLYVSDSFSRVLVFPANVSANGSPASWIAGIPPTTTPPASPDTVGRSTFGAPKGIFVMPDGRVGVLDAGYSRILMFAAVDSWPSPASRTTPSPAATGILGQAGFVVASTDPNRYINGSNGSTTPAAESSAGTFASPFFAMLSGSNELFVADTFNHRVLVLPQQGTSFGPATRVFGQDQFNYNTVNIIEGREFQFVATDSAGNVHGDASMVIDQTSNPPHLYVADPYNNRILGFNDARAVRPGATADLVLGQPDVFHSECNYPKNDPNQATSSSLCQPIGLALDSRGNLWVADTQNHRVLRFPTPFVQRTNLQPADQVIGQPNFTSNSRSFVSFGLPYGIALDSDIRMTISDQIFNRVLIYELQGSTWTRTKVLGQTDPNNCPGTTCPTGSALNQMRGPAGVAMDSSGIVYVADAGNNRVLIFSNTLQLSNGDSAQSYSLTTGLSTPQSVFVNQQTGEIWVTNTNSNTVFRYPQLDSIVKGNNQPFVMQEAINTLAVAQDQFGDLYVADFSNRIVVHYPAVLAVNGATFLLAPNSPNPNPLAPGMIASICPPLRTGSTGACAADDLHQFGEDTASFNDLPNPIPLPAILADTQVLLNGNAVPLLAVTPRQINFQVPMSAPLGTSVLEVLRPSTGQTIGSSPIAIAVTSPGLFRTDIRTTAVFAPGSTDPCRGPLGICYQAAAGNQDGSANSPTNPALHGTTITLFGTGQGVVPDAPPDGELTPPTQINTPQTPRLFLGATDQTSNIAFSGLAPGLIGVWQINLKIADSFQAIGTGPGSNYIVVVQTANGAASNDANRLQVTIAIK